MAEATGGSVPAGAQRGKRARQQPARFGCADMKLSAAQVFGREDENEALADHGPPPPAPPFARPPRSPPPTPALVRHRSPRRRHHQPARVAGSDGTPTDGTHRFSRSGRSAKGRHLSRPKARTLSVLCTVDGGSSAARHQRIHDARRTGRHQRDRRCSAGGQSGRADHRFSRFRYSPRFTGVVGPTVAGTAAAAATAAVYCGSSSKVVATSSQRLKGVRARESFGSDSLYRGEKEIWGSKERKRRTKRR